MSDEDSRAVMITKLVRKYRPKRSQEFESTATTKSLFLGYIWCGSVSSSMWINLHLMLTTIEATIAAKSGTLSSLGFLLEICDDHACGDIARILWLQEPYRRNSIL